MPFLRGLALSEENNLAARIENANLELTRAAAVSLIEDARLDRLSETDLLSYRVYEHISVRDGSDRQSERNEGCHSNETNVGTCHGSPSPIQ